MSEVVVLGEALCDFFALDESGVATTSGAAHRFVRISGGAPANFAIGLARRGVSVEMLTELGDDPMGRFLLDALNVERIGTTHVRVSSRAKTGVSFVSVDGQGERSFDFYRVPSSDMLIDPHTVAGRLPLRGVKVFHFGTNSLLFPGGREAIALCVRSAREHGVLVSCDLNLRAHNWPSQAEMAEQARWAAAQSDWLKISDEELAACTGSSEPDEAAAWLLARGVRLIALTEGPLGARIYDQQGLRARGPSLAIDVLDTTGAGDAFYSGFVSSTLGGQDAERALRAGLENAASVIAQVGATPGLLRA